MALLRIKLKGIPAGLAQVVEGGDAAVKGAVQQIAGMACAEWRNLAASELRTTAQTYQNGIQKPEFRDGKATIALTGAFPNLLEQGWGGGDMRQWMLGPKASSRHPIIEKGKVVGWYANVPFRHGMPGSTTMRAMGSAYAGAAPEGTSRAGIHTGLTAEAAKKLGQAVYREARKLSPTLRTAEGTAWGGRLQTRPEMGGVPLLHRGHHALDLYADMVRLEHTYENATQSYYMTWRRISSRTPNGWMHPGLTGRHLADKVAEFVRSVSSKYVVRVIHEVMRP